MHPPLAIWLMTLVRIAFGTTTVVSRSVSAVAAVVAIFFFYKLASRLFSRWTALFSSLALGTAQNFIWYSHHAQLDVPMFACIMATVYFAVRTFEENKSKYAIVAGLLFACALLSKAVQGLYLIPFLFSLPYIYKGHKQYVHLVIILCVALIIALPWYVFMFTLHPEIGREYAALVGSIKDGTYAGTSGNALSNRWWFYLNQSIINFPVIILGLVTISSLIRKWMRRDTIYSRMSLVTSSWFCAMLIFLSSFATRMPHFYLFLLLPTSLLIAFFIEEFLQLPVKRQRVGIAVLLLFIAVGWSGSELVRRGVREHVIPDLHSIYLFLAILFISLMILSWFLFKQFHLSSTVIVLFTLSCFYISVDYYRWEMRERGTYFDGATETAGILLHTPEIHSLIAYQDGSAHESYLPQLNYYTNGWLLGWDSSKTGMTKTWAELDSLMRINQIYTPDASVIYVSWDAFYSPKPEERELLTRINNGLNARYEKSIHTKKYQLYWQPVKN